ncbi:MAG: hypothetical protein K8R90_02185 [Candidatus Cloacimonetes bacterium]|nr:hypothetical protein [Candidatus Cloacimonadota bacterium]
MMRALLILALLSAIGGLCAQVQLQACLGIDSPGIQEFGADGDRHRTNPGLSFSAEALYSARADLHLGCGVEYQLLRATDADWGGDPAFGFIPIFFSGKIGLPINCDVMPEMLLHIGYGFLTGNDDYIDEGDLTGGLYWGIGAGVVHKSGFTADLMFRRSKGAWEMDFSGYPFENDIIQHNLTLRLGYRFSIL